MTSVSFPTLCQQRWEMWGSAYPCAAWEAVQFLVEGPPGWVGNLDFVPHSVFIHSSVLRGWQLEYSCPAHLGFWQQELCISMVQAVNPSAETLKLFPVQPIALRSVFSLKSLSCVACQQWLSPCAGCLCWALPSHCADQRAAASAAASPGTHWIWVCGLRLQELSIMWQDLQPFSIAWTG